MSNMFGKFKEIMGFGDYEDEFDDLEETEVEEELEEEIEPIISKQKGNKVVNIHTASTAKVMVTKPTNYDDARETKIAQRLVDFISGSCYVLGATLQEIEQRVYLLSPSNVEVTNELKNELSSKALFNWNK